MTEHNTDPMYALMSKVGEIAADIKHILHAQEMSGRRMSDLDKRITALKAETDARIRPLEAFRWKLLGISTIVPTVIALAALYLKGAFGV